MPSTLHQCFKYVEDDATVRMMFAEKQPFKGVKNYFTDALLYQEIDKVSKELLPNNDAVATRQIQSLKETCQLLWSVNQL